MARILVSILLALSMLLVSWLIYKKFTSNVTEEVITTEKYVKSVAVARIENSDIPISITSHGKLVAKRRVALIPEVTGVIISSNFKEGVTYRKGETIFEIDDEEIYASLVSMRSEFRGKLIAITPDLMQDHGANGEKWKNYLSSVNINSNLPELPSFSDVREENFITTNGIVALYQRVKNLEIRLNKFRLIAPFDGIITIANAQEGSFAAIGQPVGEISSFGDFELELPISIENLKYVKVGNRIKLKTIEGNQSYNGTISRINPRASMDAQSILAYVSVKNRNLREGMFLEAKMNAGLIKNATEIDRSLLNNDNEVFVLQTSDSTILSQEVEPLYYNEKTAVVKGLEDGTLIISKLPAGAFWGMKVKVLNQENN